MTLSVAADFLPGYYPYTIWLLPGLVRIRLQNRDGYCVVTGIFCGLSALRVGDILESLDFQPFVYNGTYVQWFALLQQRDATKPRRVLQIRRRRFTLPPPQIGTPAAIPTTAAASAVPHVALQRRIMLPSPQIGTPAANSHAGYYPCRIRLPPGPVGIWYQNQNGYCVVQGVFNSLVLLYVGDILESLDLEPFVYNGTLEQWFALLSRDATKPRRVLQVRRRLSSPQKGTPAAIPTTAVAVTVPPDTPPTVAAKPLVISPEEKKKCPGKSQAENICAEEDGFEEAENPDDNTEWSFITPSLPMGTPVAISTAAVADVVPPAAPHVMAITRLPEITPEKLQEKKCQRKSKAKSTTTEADGLRTEKIQDENTDSPSRSACAFSRGIVSLSISLPPGPIGAAIENQNGFCAVNHLNEPTSLLQVGDILESLDGEPLRKYATLYQWGMCIYGTRNKPIRQLKIRRRETQPIPSTKSDPARVRISPAKAANMGDGGGEFNSCLEAEKIKRAARKREATTKLQRISLAKPEAEKGHVEAQLRQTKHLDFQVRVSSERVREVASRRAPEREENKRAIKNSSNVVFYGTKQKRPGNDGMSRAPCLRTMDTIRMLRARRTGYSPSKSTRRLSSTLSWSTTDLVEWMKPVDKSLEGLGWTIIRRSEKRCRYFPPGEDWESQCDRLCTIRKLMDFLKKDSKWKNLSEIKTAIEGFETARKQGKELSDNRNKESDEEEDPSQNAKKNRASLVMDLAEAPAVTKFIQGEEYFQRKTSDTPLAPLDTQLEDDDGGSSTDDMATLRTERSKRTAAMVAVAAPPRKRRKSKAISPSEDCAEVKQGETEELDVKPGMVSSSDQIQAMNPSQRARKVKSRASSVGDDTSSEEHDDNLVPLEKLAGRENEKRRRDVQDSTALTETELPSIRTTLRSLKTVRTFCQKKGVCEELCAELEKQIRDYWLDEAMSNDSPTMFG